MNTVGLGAPRAMDACPRGAGRKEAEPHQPVHLNGINADWGKCGKKNFVDGARLGVSGASGSVGERRGAATPAIKRRIARKSVASGVFLSPEDSPGFLRAPLPRSEVAAIVERRPKKEETGEGEEGEIFH